MLELNAGFPVPELPEVETVCRGLSQTLPGDRIKAVAVLRKESIGYPSPEEFEASLPGHRFEKLARRGKYLLITLDKGAGLAVHLRMSGRLLLSDRARQAGSHLRVRISLDSGRELRFEDMRVFGRLWYVPPGSFFEEIVSGLADLGVEPLENLSGRHLHQSLGRRTQAIKSALLDQRVVAGLGNIYADESLFAARINPLRSAGDLTRRELDRLTRQIQAVLQRAIDLGGSTLRDYKDSRGVNGSYQEESFVYGRAGLPCLSCGGPIRKLRLAGRSTHFCPRCQPERR